MAGKKDEKAAEVETKTEAPKAKVSAEKLATLKAKELEILKARVALQLLQAEYQSLSLAAKLEAKFENVRNEISKTGEEVERRASPQPLRPGQPT